MTYREQPTGHPGAVLWRRTVSAGEERSRILPDGCLDLIWDGRRLVVAGPDSTARWHESPAGTPYVALRFSQGTGPAALGVSAVEIRDRTPELAELWGAAPARELTERVATDPADALGAWVATASRADGGAGPAIFSMAGEGLPVPDMAARVGYGVRQLHRRCLTLFGYGPRHLSRILRLGRALAQARGGTALADVAASCGYADQAHLSRDVRDLTGTTPTGLLGGGYPAGGSGANRSTGVPSGSRTTA